MPSSVDREAVESPVEVDEKLPVFCIREAGSEAASAFGDSIADLVGLPDLDTER